MENVERSNGEGQKKEGKLMNQMMGGAMGEVDEKIRRM